ncbi:hypothetical protein LTR50_003165 [Elasticomyces elasticus]|nr:hypothetical protein LTR50_003165 [Elasticomyces elasticus]
MSNFHYAAPHYAPSVSSHSSHSGAHHGRSRRGPRVSSASQNSHRQFKAQRSPKETAPETPASSAYLRDFEAARSFDFEDDELFCPFNLLTDDDLRSIHSAASSDRSSLSSGSPETSPLQHQVQPTPSFLLSSAPTPAYNSASSGFQSSSHHQMKLHQPLAQRTRNAIPIVDPSTRSITSPPPSVSPARQMQGQYMAQRRWM